MKFKDILITGLLLLLISACSEKKPTDSMTQGGMKCGPGKCGASMVDGSAVLVKKKMNILNQLDENDNRRECVLTAMTTKALYACVRVEKTGRLSTKCASENRKITPNKGVSTMKCEADKCGSGM
ncbi:MAG: hypothetical protein U9O64_08950 [Campylobacterota bacterium]|nr:hypothetical protein [Campylobacterota bacterium]